MSSSPYRTSGQSVADHPEVDRPKQLHEAKTNIYDGYNNSKPMQNLLAQLVQQLQNMQQLVTSERLRAEDVRSVLLLWEQASAEKTVAQFARAMNRILSGVATRDSLENSNARASLDKIFGEELVLAALAEDKEH